jgi:hypothetical protein
MRAIERYRPPVQGRRTEGWEDVNVALLADDIGVSYRYVLAVLKDERNCTFSLLKKIASAFGVDPGHLVYRIVNHIGAFYE